MTETYVYKNQQKLRCGYTTGTCAAGAVKAALQMLLGGKVVEHVSVTAPKGTVLELQVQEQQLGEKVSCAIRKDSGDDADVTNGIRIYATVWKADGEEQDCSGGLRERRNRWENQVWIQGGVGIGRVTKPGLNQPIGNAAINSVPREMITKVALSILEQYGYEGSIHVLISAPEGVEIAKRTFNPRLGIEGGISILGTSGIVEPMSEQALVETIRVEMRQKLSQGMTHLLVVPGNYGEQFLRDTLQIDVEKAIKCSNFVGETIDMAYEYKADSMLLVGHIGKFVKLGAGIMNTHSRVADGRMEVLASCAILAGVRTEAVKEILNCLNTDEAIAILIREQMLETAMDILMKKIYYYIENRAYTGMTIGAVTFSRQYGLLGMTEYAKEMLDRLRGV
ncbi:MAG: cobalt-precorrin-5B (C(1))-methyltransferase CbiD [Lachnospiraceae bacterium]|nr:cobalt-precorrin-5B (C(1))-methyltransferase CbiD [Lachnospiraceae bacterium]